MFGAAVCCGDIRPLALSLDFFPNSESPQQDGADEKEYGAHRQDIEPQGKVHVRCLLGYWGKVNTRAPRSEAPNVLRCGRFPENFVAMANPLNVRGKKFQLRLTCSFLIGQSEKNMLRQFAGGEENTSSRVTRSCAPAPAPRSGPPRARRGPARTGRPPARRAAVRCRRAAQGC